MSNSLPPTNPVRFSRETHRGNSRNAKVTQALSGTECQPSPVCLRQVGGEGGVPVLVLYKHQPRTLPEMPPRSLRERTREQPPVLGAWLPKEAKEVWAATAAPCSIVLEEPTPLSRPRYGRASQVTGGLEAPGVPCAAQGRGLRCPGLHRGRGGMREFFL